MKRRDFLKATTAFATLAAASGCSNDTVPQRATAESDDRLVVAGKDVADLVAQSRTIPRSAYDRAMNVLRPQLQKTYIEVFAQRKR